MISAGSYNPFARIRPLDQTIQLILAWFVYFIHIYYILAKVDHNLIIIDPRLINLGTSIRIHVKLILFKVQIFILVSCFQSFILFSFSFSFLFLFICELQFLVYYIIAAHDFTN